MVDRCAQGREQATLLFHFLQPIDVGGVCEVEELALFVVETHRAALYNEDLITSIFFVLNQLLSVLESHVGLNLTLILISSFAVKYDVSERNEWKLISEVHFLPFKRTFLF